jgi:hypothetical protein
MKSKAIFKLNSGEGALLCNKCSIIIKTGKDFTHLEWAAMKGIKKMPAQYCDKCKNKI